MATNVLAYLNSQKEIVKQLSTAIAILVKIMEHVLIHLVDTLCNCPPQFTGLNCDSHFYCHSSPCQNGGACVNLHNGYRCDCLPQFTGGNVKLLSTAIAIHVKIKAVYSHSGYSCNCPRQFTGVNCEARFTAITFHAEMVEHV